MASQKLIYSAVSKIEFTEEDIQSVIADNKSGTKTIASLYLDNMSGGQITSGTLSAFEALAKVLKLPVVKNYNGLEIARPYTDEENREAAVQSLKYGYSDLSTEIRAMRAEEQEIVIFEPPAEEEPADS